MVGGLRWPAANERLQTPLANPNQVSPRRCGKCIPKQKQRLRVSNPRTTGHSKPPQLCAGRRRKKRGEGDNGTTGAVGQSRRGKPHDSGGVYPTVWTSRSSSRTQARRNCRNSLAMISQSGRIFPVCTHFADLLACRVYCACLLATTQWRNCRRRRRDAHSWLQ
jgi:hypothetical protein